MNLNKLSNMTPKELWQLIEIANKEIDKFPIEVNDRVKVIKGAFRDRQGFVKEINNEYIVELDYHQIVIFPKTYLRRLT